MQEFLNSRFFFFFKIWYLKIRNLNLINNSVMNDNTFSFKLTMIITSYIIAGTFSVYYHTNKYEKCMFKLENYNIP